MHYKHRVSVLILLISSPLFCANDIREAYVDEEGKMHISSTTLKPSELADIACLSKHIVLHCANPQDLFVYKKSLLHVPTVACVVKSLITATAVEDPELTEQMLKNYVSLEKERIEYARLLYEIGCGYFSKKNFEKAQSLLMQSVEIIPFMNSTYNLACLYASNGYLSAGAYWIAQHKKQGFTEKIFIPNAFEVVCNVINDESAAKKINFQSEVASILQNEEEGLYDPAILAMRTDL